jgi:hypothetical protein
MTALLSGLSQLLTQPDCETRPLLGLRCRQGWQAATQDPKGDSHHPWSWKTVAGPTSTTLQGPSLDTSWELGGDGSSVES